MGRACRATTLVLLLAASCWAGADAQAGPGSFIFRPLSGEWKYEGTMSPGELGGPSCPGLLSMVRTAAGPALLTSAPHGLSVRLRLGSTVLDFVRHGPEPFYRTDPRPFPVRVGDTTAAGTVEFELTVDTPRRVKGTTRWDNGLGCRAAYPFTLSLVVESEPAAVVPQAGTWIIDPWAAPCSTLGAVDGGVSTLAGIATLALGPVNSLTLAPPMGGSITLFRNTPLSWRGPVVFQTGAPPGHFTGELLVDFVLPTRAMGTLVATGTLTAASTQTCVIHAPLSIRFVHP